MGGFAGGLGGGHGGGHGGGGVLLKGRFSGGFGGGLGGGHGFHSVQALQGPTYLVKTVHHVHKLHGGGGHLGGHGGSFGGGFGSGHKVVFLGGHGHGWHGR
ncbi:holotricin-3-like [Ornithodoros turicata]|uniref:holotricin-3-like n=1 Tax=Ornithodoros turicata TaxID=34597 RepID=UPI00313A347D